MKRIVNLPQSRFYILVLFTVFWGLLATRRWEVLANPQVWDEDGTGALGSCLADYIDKGWSAIFDPVSGYFLLVPKIISGISLGISFSQYPIISTAIAWLVIALVGLAITLSPTHIKGKFLCAVSVFFIPTDPEVFGLSLYTFWWTSLLLFLLALWDKNRSHIGWRLLFLIAGGLSSPTIIMILPILYIRVYYYRSLRSELIVALTATLIAGIQGFFIINNSATKLPAIESVLTNFVPTFFGRFLIGNWFDNKVLLWLAGLVMIGTIAHYLVRERNSLTAWVLVYLLIGTITMMVARHDPALIHPRMAGPRYFFFPFILTFWILIQQYQATYSNWLRGFIGLLAVTAVINAATVLTRQHDDLHWTNHVLSCRLFTEYAIPVQYNGNRALAWSLRLSGKKCDELLASDPFVAVGVRTFPYRVIDNIAGGVATGQVANESSIVKNEWTGRDWYSFNSGVSTLPGFKVLGSFLHSAAEAGELTLHLSRGARVYFRSEPKSLKQRIVIADDSGQYMQDLPNTSKWVLLEFSNATLPEEFDVKFVDGGDGWGEWSAIGLKFD